MWNICTISIMEYFAHKVLLSLNTCCSFCCKSFNSKTTTHKNLTFSLLNSDFLITQIPPFIFLWLFKKHCQTIAVLDSYKKTNTYKFTHAETYTLDQLIGYGSSEK